MPIESLSSSTGSTFRVTSKQATRLGDQVSRKISALFGKVQGLDSCHVFPYKFRVRSTASKSEHAVRDYSVADIRVTYVTDRKKLQDIKDLRLRIESAYHTNYPGSETTKTKTALSNFLQTSAVLNIKIQEMEDLLELCKDPSAEIFFKALNLPDVDKPDLSNLRLDLKASKMLKWMVVHSDDLADILALDIPANSSFLKKIPSLFFLFFPSLESFTCRGHEITELPNDLKVHCPRLRMVDVGDNFIKVVPSSLENLVDLSVQRQHGPIIYDQNVDEIFRHLKTGTVAKPIFSGSQQENNETLKNWLVKNAVALGFVNTLKIPAGSPIKKLSLSILQYLTGLTQIVVSHCELVELPDLLETCPDLESILVDGNYLTERPESLRNLVDLTSQPQRFPMVYDTNANILLQAIPLEGKPATNASDEEKNNWFLAHKDALKTITSLEIHPGSEITDLSSCILQYMPLQKISCRYAQLQSLSINLLRACPQLTELDVSENWLIPASVHPSLSQFVDFSRQRLLVFANCVSVFSKEQLERIDKLLYDYDYLLGLRSTSTKVVSDHTFKNNLRAAISILLKNSDYKLLSEKHILYALTENPKSFEGILSKIGSINRKKTDLIAEDSSKEEKTKLFKKGSGTLSDLESCTKSLGAFYSQILDQQEHFDIFVNPESFKDSKALFDRVSQAILHRTHPCLEGTDIRENAVVMASFLIQNSAALDTLTSLDVSSCHFDKCPEKFIILYLKNVRRIQCTSTQATILSKFAKENRIRLDVAREEQAHL